MSSSIQKRQRRAAKARYKIKEMRKVRLSIHKTPRHIYAQVIDGDAKNVLASASTLDKTVKLDSYSGNKAAAEKIGQIVAERAIANGVTEVAFDRSGFKFHGRVEALAEGARKAGLKF